jgi:hypothetical protein
MLWRREKSRTSVVNRTTNRQLPSNCYAHYYYITLTQYKLVRYVQVLLNSFAKNFLDINSLPLNPVCDLHKVLCLYGLDVLSDSLGSSPTHSFGRHPTLCRYDN